MTSISWNSGCVSSRSLDVPHGTASQNSYPKGASWAAARYSSLDSTLGSLLAARSPRASSPSCLWSPPTPRPVCDTRPDFSPVLQDCARPAVCRKSPPRRRTAPHNSECPSPSWVVSLSKTTISHIFPALVSGKVIIYIVS